MKFVLILATIIVGVLSADNPAFFKIGSYGGKSYYISKYFKANWPVARVICKDYGYKLASFETLKELNAVQKLCKANTNLFERFTIIDGLVIDQKSNTWYLTVSATKVAYAMPFYPGEPNNISGNETALSLAQPDYLLNDTPTEAVYKFLCEK